jgi:hypothetical protein
MRLINKIFIWIGLFGLIIWICYLVFQLTSWKNSLEPSSIFSSKDEQVLVLNKPNSFEWAQIEFSTLNENRNLVNPLLSNLPSNSRVYISKKRNLILVEGLSTWTIDDVKVLLKKSNFRFSITDNELKIEQFQAVFKNNKLLIYKYEDGIEGLDFDWSQLDKNATASLVRFNKSKIDFLDIFIKNENTVEYHSKNAGNIKGKLIDDISIFHSYVPANSSGYQFFETSYLISVDPVFKKSPVSRFINNGIISYSYKGNTVLMCDFKEGQNLVQNLNDYFKLQENNTLKGLYNNLNISSRLIKNITSYFVSTIDNIAILSASEEINNAVLEEIQLGKTWLYNDDDLLRNNKNLPKLVSYRSFSSMKNSSISVVGDKLIQTDVKFRSEKLLLNTDLDYLSILIAKKVHDFTSFNGKGNMVCVTDNGDILGIENGIKTWRKTMVDKPIGDIQILKSKDNEFVVITGTNSIHVLDKYGKYLNNFPLKIDKSNIVCQSNAYFSNGQVFAGFVDDKNQINVYDSHGNRIKSLQVSIRDSWQKLDFFTSNSKLHVILQGIEKCAIYNLNEQSLTKEFNDASSFKICDAPNSTIVAYSKNGKLHGWQFGKDEVINSDDTKLPYAEIILSAKQLDSILYTFSVSNTKLIVAKNYSEVMFEKDFGASRISTGDIYQNNFREIYFTVVSGDENGIYLYDSQGRMYVKGMIEGTKKAVLTQTPGYSVSLTTLINGYLVQYNIK